MSPTQADTTTGVHTMSVQFTFIVTLTALLLSTLSNAFAAEGAAAGPPENARRQ